MRWITRERARVDRIACPWLISRFVDPTPEFLFVPAREVLAAAEREHAIPYDVPDVELGHHGSQCSFDAFIDRYELTDPALTALAAIVRGADTDDRRLTPESAGLYAAATGFQATSRDDFDNMARQFPMYDALYAYCRAQAVTGPPPRVLFVCLHGAAKSVVAAAHFRRLAAARGLSIGAGAAGTEPDRTLAPGAVRGLAGDGLAAAPSRPRPITLYDLDSATRIVSFGCAVVPARGQRVDQWDVPAVSEGYEAARDRIVANVERLVAELAAGADVARRAIACGADA
jgi:protein-tyrosine-phosphatase